MKNLPVRQSLVNDILNFISEHRSGIVSIKGLSGSGKSTLLSSLLRECRGIPLTLTSQFRVDGLLEHPLRPIISLFSTLISGLPDEDWQDEDLTPVTRFFRVFEGIERGEAKEVLEIISSLIYLCPAVFEEAPDSIPLEIYPYLTSLNRVDSLIEREPSMLKKIIFEMLKSIATRVASPGPIGYKIVLIVDGYDLLPPFTQEIFSLLSRNLPSGVFFIFAGEEEPHFMKEGVIQKKNLSLELTPLSIEEIGLLIKDRAGTEFTPSQIADLFKGLHIFPSDIIHWTLSSDFQRGTINEDSINDGTYILENLSSLPEQYGDYLKTLSLLPMPPTGFFRDLKLLTGKESKEFLLKEFIEITEKKDLLKGEIIPWFSTRSIKKVISSSITQEEKTIRIQTIVRNLEKRYAKELKCRTAFPLSSIYSMLLPSAGEDMEKVYNESFQQGLLHFRLLSFERAKEFFEESQNTGAMMKDPVRTASSQNAIGLTFLKMGNPYPASIYFKKSVESIQKASSPSLQASFLFNLSIALIEWGKEDPEPHLLKVIELAEKTGLSELLFKGIRVLMNYYSDCGRSADCFDLLKEGVERVERWKDKESFSQVEAIAFFEDAAEIVFSSGMYEDALDLLCKALKYREATPSKFIEEIAIDNLLLGKIYERLGRNEKALEHYRKILALVEKEENLELHWRLLNLIGITFASSNRIQEAKKRLTTALHILKGSHETAGIAKVINNLGMVSLREGDYYESLSKLEESLKIKRKLHDERGIASSLSNIATIYLFMNRDEDTVRTIEEAREVARRCGDKLLLSTILNNRGFIMERLGRFEEAVESYRDSLELKEVTFDLAGKRTTLINLASLFYEMGNWNKALILIEEVIDIDKRLGLETLNNDMKFKEGLKTILHREEDRRRF